MVALAVLHLDGGLETADSPDIESLDPVSQIAPDEINGGFFLNDFERNAVFHRFRRFGFHDFDLRRFLDQGLNVSAAAQKTGNAPCFLGKADFEDLQILCRDWIHQFADFSFVPKEVDSF